MRVHRHECRSCRENVDLLRRSTEFESCPFCEDGELEWQATVGVVYSRGTIFDLRVRELVEEWREKGIQIHQQNPNPSESAGRKAANQLEELIEHE